MQQKPQIERFKEAARELGTDDDEERFNEKLRKPAKAGRGEAMMLSQLSDDAIKELHNATAKAYASDRDQLSALWGHYGVDQTANWPRHVSDLEAELSRRGINFVAIAV